MLESIDADTRPAYRFTILGTDTLNLASAENVKGWTFPACALHYRVVYAATGTQRSTPKAYYMLRK